MKKLELNEMENVSGGAWYNFTGTQVGCGLLGLAAGIASGLNPIVGGLTAAGCLAMDS
tara:strand:- start:6328 stop:6501 length:174 start_codon:yes stop_codon:yes gene_type:complete